ncbi:hypothetical protein C8R44DRAFT_876930 [Mycena epipterygia]|nr:hypothetical protein C8R44DRAFT_876930 [Mycena epipterygia]
MIQKMCFLAGMLYYASASLLIFLNPLPGLLMLILKPSHVNYDNFVFVVPSLIENVLVFRLWSRQSYNFSVNFVYVIQQYTYLMAIKDKIFNTTALWVPFGDAKAQQGVKGGNNKYRNSRILCAIWVYSAFGAVIGLSAWRIVRGYH